MLMRNDLKFRDAVCFKFAKTKRISDHQSDSLLPTHWKTISLNSEKLFTFHITDEISGLSAEKTTPSLSHLVRNTWEWNGPYLHILETS